MSSTDEERGNTRLASLIDGRREALAKRLIGEWRSHLQASEPQVETLVNKVLVRTVETLETGAADRLIDSFTAWVMEQAWPEAGGLKPAKLLRMIDSLHQSLWDVITEVQEEETALRALMDLFAEVRVATLDALMTAREVRQGQILDQQQGRTARLEEAHAALAQQVRQLSSPVIQVWEEVLVLPLVGAIDAQRANRVTEDLLQGIVEQQAEIVIIDVTGVPMVDTNVVNHLMKTVKAANLLGAQSVVVGISAEVAQMMIQLGIDLQEIVTCRNLQAGIEFAMQRLGLQIVLREPAERESHEAPAFLEEAEPLTLPNVLVDG